MKRPGVTLKSNRDTVVNASEKHLECGQTVGTSALGTASIPSHVFLWECMDALSVQGKVSRAHKSNFTAHALENWRLEKPQEAQAGEMNCWSSWEKL